MNKSVSNYDTDLFLPLFDAIKKQTECPEYGKGRLDASYRIVSDHLRMVSACLADGMLPDFNHRLRSVIRRLISTAHKNFSGTSDQDNYNDTIQLLLDLYSVNSEILGQQYRELIVKSNRFDTVMRHEVEVFKQMEISGRNAMPKISQICPPLAELIQPQQAPLYLDALQILGDFDGQEIDGKLAFLLYDSVGLKPYEIRTLASAKGLSFEDKDFEKVLQSNRRKSKESTAKDQGVYFSCDGKTLTTLKSLMDIPRQMTSLST